MSTTTDNTSTSNAATIPPPAPDRSGNIRFINISNGELKHKPKNGEVEVLKEIYGYIKRVALHSSDYNGNIIEGLEVELSHPHEGTSIVSVSTQNSVGSGMFMSFFLECKEGEYIRIRTNRSPDKNKFGAYTTYVNGDIYNGATNNWAEIRVTKPGSGSWKDAYNGLLEKFCELPFYGERSSGREEEGEFQFFKQEILAKGWPSIEGNEDAYLAWMNGALGLERKSLEDFEEDEWNEIRPVVAAAKKIPKVLQNPFEGE